MSASPRPLRQDNSALSPDSAVLGWRVFTSATTRKTLRTISDDARAITENIEDIKSMESAANNNHANWEEIITRRAANEDILEHPDSDKKFPSNLKLKSLLEEAIKRGRDTAASQKAPGTGKRKSMIIYQETRMPTSVNESESQSIFPKRSLCLLPGWRAGLSTLSVTIKTVKGIS